MELLRHFVTRRCAVCDWAGAPVEPHGDGGDCPFCHAPTEIAREEWLIDVAEVRAQAARYGRIGGMKGGRIRAERLSPARRRDIAKKAAAARWRRR
jgi:hypothetical protein